jgi:hypothetical protein
MGDGLAEIGHLAPRCHLAHLDRDNSSVVHGPQDTVVISTISLSWPKVAAGGGFVWLLGWNELDAMAGPPMCTVCTVSVVQKCLMRDVARFL